MLAFWFIVHVVSLQVHPGSLLVHKDITNDHQEI